jgi:hypothetical protein
VADDGPLRKALLSELERYSAQDARGDVCVLNDGKPLRPGACAEREIQLSPLDQGAARATNDFLIQGMKDEQGVHAESMIAMLGGLLGRRLLMEHRSEWENVGPQFTAIYIEDVNQALFETAGFIESIYGQRTKAALAVADTVPDENSPNPAVLNSLPSVLEKLESGLAQAKVEAARTRWVLAFALILALEMTGEALANATALRLALRYMVRGAKTPAAHLKALAP